MRRDIAPSIIAIAVLTLLLGIAYPLTTTGVAQVLWPHRADGVVRLIGRDFSGDRTYFLPRPSATGYSGDVTFFNNLGPNSAKLRDQIAKARAAYVKRE